MSAELISSVLRALWLVAAAAMHDKLGRFTAHAPHSSRRRRSELYVSSCRFLARDVIYTSRAYATMSVSVCLSVRLSVTEVHWRIIANLGFKFRSNLPRIAAAVLLAVLLAGGSSRVMLASARVSCLWCLWFIKLWVLGGALAATRVVRRRRSVASLVKNDYVATAATSRNESETHADAGLKHVSTCQSACYTYFPFLMLNVTAC